MVEYSAEALYPDRKVPKSVWTDRQTTATINRKIKDLFKMDQTQDKQVQEALHNWNVFTKYTAISTVIVAVIVAFVVFLVYY